MSSPTTSAPTAPIDLTHLRVGDRARLESTRLSRADSALLEALGLTEHSELRVCQVGDPCILQVRSTRIGVAQAVAKAIFVVPEGSP